MNTPQKNKKRAARRWEKQKKFRKAKEVAHKIFPGMQDKAWEEQWAKKHTDNLKACGCWMCQNPRRTFNELTLQEKKFKESVLCD